MRKILRILKENWIKYGFETVVVTVGILGAFALENWKDNRQQEKELREIYRTISEDLQADALTLDTLLEKYEWRVHIMRRIVMDSVTMEDWIQNDSLASSFIGYPDFQESLRGLELLKSRIAINAETGILAGHISQFYNERLLKNKVYLTEVEGMLNNNVEHWVDDAEWLSTYFVDEDHTQLAEYALDNPYFRNRISTYMVVLANYHDNLNIYREEGRKLAQEINAFLDDY